MPAVRLPDEGAASVLASLVQEWLPAAARVSPSCPPISVESDHHFVRATNGLLLGLGRASFLVGPERVPSYSALPNPACNGMGRGAGFYLSGILGA